MSETSTTFRLMGFNVLGTRFSTKASWLLRRKNIVKRASRVKNDVTEDYASIYAFLECRAYEMEYLGSELKLTGHISSPLGCSVGVRGDWVLGRHWVVPIDRAHDALVVEATRDGVTINVIVAHLPPFNTQSAQKAREAAFRKVSDFVDGWQDSCIWYLDANWRTTFEAFAARYGWASSRTKAAFKLRSDYRTNGMFIKGRNIDYVLYKPGNRSTSKVAPLGYRVLKGWGSDHHAITTQFTAK